MNKNFYLLTVFLAGVLSFACSGGANDANVNRSNHANQNTNDPHAGHNMNAGETQMPTAPAAYKIESVSNPASVEAGKEAEITFVVKDKNGNQIKDFKVVHEKKMHLIVVSDDLAEFEHLHPELQSDGRFVVRHNFKHGGKFLLYPDATPVGAAQVVGRIELNVSGAEKPREALAADLNFKKSQGGLSVEMKPKEALSTAAQATISFVVTDEETGAPVTDLQNYLGELAHVVVIGENTQDFLHVHPTSVKTADETSVVAHTNFPRAGIYKVWAQFQRGGKVITVPYVINVANGARAAESAAKPANGAVKITVSGEGFTPSAVEAEKDKPVKLVFYRADANNCGDEVVFPKLNLRKDIPVGQETTIEISPKETGEIAFNCGMDMMKGKIVVQ